MKQYAFGQYATLKTSHDGYRCSMHWADVSEGSLRVYHVEDRGQGGKNTLAAGHTPKTWTDVGPGHIKASTNFRSIDFTFTRGAWEFTLDGRTYRKNLPVCVGENDEYYKGIFAMCTIL